MTYDYYHSFLFFPPLLLNSKIVTMFNEKDSDSKMTSPDSSMMMCVWVYKMHIFASVTHCIISGRYVRITSPGDPTLWLRTQDLINNCSSLWLCQICTNLLWTEKSKRITFYISGIGRDDVQTWIKNFDAPRCSLQLQDGYLHSHITDSQKAVGTGFMKSQSFWINVRKSSWQIPCTATSEERTSVGLYKWEL